MKHPAIVWFDGVKALHEDWQFADKESLFVACYEAALDDAAEALSTLQRERDVNYALRMEHEKQLCRIAQFIGRDAIQAPETDPTIAGATIAYITELRDEIAERVRAETIEAYWQAKNDTNGEPQGTY